MPIPNTTGKDDWRTPPLVLDWVRSRYGRIDLDLCATDQTVAVCPLYVGPGRAGLGGEEHVALDRHDIRRNDWTDALRWDPELWTAPASSHVWCNPPYSRPAGGLEAWCRKMYEVSLAGYRVTSLFFARTETVAWHEYVAKASEVWFIRRRLKFLDPETGEPRHPAPAPSVLVHWDAHQDWRNPATREGGSPDYHNLDLQAWADGGEE